MENNNWTEWIMIVQLYMCKDLALVCMEYIYTPIILFYPSGRILSISTPKLFETRYPNGLRKLRVNYINGTKNGRWIEWHENGKIYDHGIYKNGLKIRK